MARTCALSLVLIVPLGSAKTCSTGRYCHNPSQNAPSRAERPPSSRRKRDQENNFCLFYHSPVPVSRLSALSISTRRRWTGVAALVVSVGLAGCLKPGGSAAATAGSGSTSGLSDGSTSQTKNSTDPTSTSASGSSGATEGTGCLPDEVVRCRLDDEGKCGPDSDCVHLDDCDPLLCDDPEIEWFPPCESTCAFGWSCTPSADPSLLRCTVEEPGECRPYEIYRCRLDAQGECGPGSGCVDQRHCNPHLCVDPDTPSSAQDCESV